MEVCLALTNKFDKTETAEEKESKDPNKLFNRTKQLLIDVMQCVEGNIVGELATGPTLPTEEERYKKKLIQIETNRNTKQGMSMRQVRAVIKDDPNRH
ncbi:hypothetical protein SK128_004209 [Halocaridina rubra]|uniref:Uncharacterized protein n=1 Tax=Halocaridina rubra TaxID=373956 RepID=A0AAN8X2T2_HALRR